MAEEGKLTVDVTLDDLRAALARWEAIGQAFIDRVTKEGGPEVSVIMTEPSRAVPPLEALKAAVDVVDALPQWDGNPNYTRALFAVFVEARAAVRAALAAGEPTPALVAGDRMERTIADFIRACGVQIVEEQERISPNNALISVLCDAVRLAREQFAPVVALPPARQVEEKSQQ